MGPWTRTADQLVFTGGVGTGPDKMSAFDAALGDAGIQDANLLEVSSVIPRDAELVADVDPAAIEAAVEPGVILPVVVSRATTRTPGESVFAAVAGQRLTAGHGVNVEVNGRAATREEAATECERLLGRLAANRDAEVAGRRYFRYESATLSADADEVTCAFAGVVYLPVARTF